MNIPNFVITEESWANPQDIFSIDEGDYITGRNMYKDYETARQIRCFKWSKGRKWLFNILYFIMGLGRRRYYNQYYDITADSDIADNYYANLERKEKYKIFNTEVKRYMVKSGFTAFTAIMVICALFLIKTVYNTYDVSKANEVKAHIEKIELENRLLKEELISTKNDKEKLNETLSEVHAVNKGFEETLASLKESNKELEETITKLSDEKNLLNQRINKIEMKEMAKSAPVNQTIPLLSLTGIPISQSIPSQHMVENVVPESNTVVKTTENSVKEVNKKEEIKAVAHVKKEDVAPKKYVEYFTMKELYSNANIKRTKIKLSNYSYALSGNKYNLTNEQVQLIADVLHTKRNVVPMHVMIAIYYNESKFNPNNSNGERFFGLGGIHKLLATDYNKIIFNKPKEYQEKYAFDPHFNIIISAMYFSDLVSSQKGDLNKALALYYGERIGYTDKIKGVNNYLVKMTGRTLDDYNKFSIKHYNDR